MVIILKSQIIKLLLICQMNQYFSIYIWKRKINNLFFIIPISNLKNGYKI